MSVKIGRESYLGVGMEDTPGTAVSAAKYLPFTTCTLRGVQEPLVDEAARGIRERVGGSITGITRGEGDVEILVDVENAPYLIIPALGSVSSAAGTGDSYVHTITRRTTNAPYTVTFVHYDGVSIRKFIYGTINTIELSISDGLATLAASVLSKLPTTGTASKDITEETVMGFKDYKLYLGDTYATLKAAVEAGTATATDLTAFSLRINNNAEAHYVSGDSNIDHVAVGQFEVEGDYTLFFEDTVQQGYYQSLDKKALIIQMIGSEITGGDYEEIFVGLPKIHFSDRTMDTAIAGFVTENPSFVAEYDKTESKSVEIIITNTESSYISPSLSPSISPSLSPSLSPSISPSISPSVSPST